MQRNRGKQQNETRDLFKKITDTKGTFHAKMGLIKDRNGMDLKEAEDIKKNSNIPGFINFLKTKVLFNYVLCSFKN